MLSELIHYLETSREQERRIIARQLHEGIGGTLTTLALTLESVYKNFPEGAYWLERKQGIQKLIADLAETNRSIQAQLQPHILDVFGLKAAIIDQVSELEKNTAISTKLTLPNEEIVVEPEQQLVLYRMMQEMLGNALTHAKLTELTIILNVEKEYVVLTVCDNAIDNVSEKNDIRQNFRLSVLRERAHYFGGRLDVFVTPGEGSQTTIRLPLCSRIRLKK